MIDMCFYFSCSTPPHTRSLALSPTKEYAPWLQHFSESVQSTQLAKKNQPFCLLASLYRTIQNDCSLHNSHFKSFIKTIGYRHHSLNGQAMKEVQRENPSKMTCVFICLINMKLMTSIIKWNGLFSQGVKVSQVISDECSNALVLLSLMKYTSHGCVWRVVMVGQCSILYRFLHYHFLEIPNTFNATEDFQRI